MNKTKSIAAGLMLTVCTTFITPAVPAYAFSLNDLTQQTTSTAEDSSDGSAIWNLLVGLLLGKLFSNVNDSSPSVSKVLGMTTSSTASTSKGQALIDTGKKYMGVPYVWGGETPDGFDCSGFTQYVMKQNGITIPRTAAEQFAAGTPVDKSNLQVGDLVFFTTYKPGASHVGFYMGNGKFLHASSAAGKVTINDLSEQFYADHYIGARRYIQ